MKPNQLGQLKIGDRVRSTDPACPRKGTITERPDADAAKVSWDDGTYDYIYADDYRGMNDFGETLLTSVVLDNGKPLPAAKRGLFASVPVSGPPYIRR